MNSVAALLASLALAFPAGLLGGEGAAPAPDVAHAAPEDSGPAVDRPAAAPPYIAYLQGYRPDAARQVRVQQRVIIRVSPARARQNLIADLPQGALPAKFQERSMDRCLPMGQIVGVQSGPQNRLILFMRDRKIVSAALEKACSARDFYSGFYVERSADGMLCSGRDTLKSRTGASCSVARLAQLVAIKD